MDANLKTLTLKLLQEHRLLTLATIRPDGWPQATTVGYGNEGLVLYFFCAADSQKARNIAACKKVSLTIDHDSDDVVGTQGLSMAATAELVTDEGEISSISSLLASKFPLFKDLPLPDPRAIRFVRLTPKVISVLDYSKGFGHTDLVEVTTEDLRNAA